MALTKQKSSGVSQKRENRAQTDRRIARTRKQLDAAFVEILHRRGYGDIRVSDIARKAGVGRATFYAHYSSKDELLRSQFRRIVTPMLAAMLDSPCPLDATAFFAHVKSAPRLFEALLGPSAGSAPRILRDCFEQRVREVTLPAEISSNGGKDVDVKRTIVATFVASTLFAVIECSLENSGSESPQALQSTFRKLVGGGLAASI